jgi:hypothetical protein
MYDVLTKSVNRLSGELSSKFVNVAEENATAQDENGFLTEQIDRIDTDIEDDSEAEPSNIVETIVSPNHDINSNGNENGSSSSSSSNSKVIISSGYSVSSSN